MAGPTATFCIRIACVPCNLADSQRGAFRCCSLPACIKIDLLLLLLPAPQRAYFPRGTALVPATESNGCIYSFAVKTYRHAQQAARKSTNYLPQGCVTGRKVPSGGESCTSEHIAWLRCKRQKASQQLHRNSWIPNLPFSLAIATQFPFLS